MWFKVRVKLELIMSSFWLCGSLIDFLFFDLQMQEWHQIIHIAYD